MQQLDRSWEIRTYRHANQLDADLYCITHPILIAIDFDSGFVYSDPLQLRLGRVGNAVRNSMCPLKNRPMRAVNPE